MHFMISSSIPPAVVHKTSTCRTVEHIHRE
jgi:hypothetical protein